MSVELKIKSKSLQAEAKFIRHEERKCLKHARNLESRQAKAERFREQFNSLQEHRKGIVRSEARATFLARAFLRGDSYIDVENKLKPCTTPAKFYTDAIVRMANMYGKVRFERESVEKWLSESTAVAV